MKAFRICYLLLLPLFIFLGFNRHSKDTYVNYHSVIFSDAAGYYVYLPYWFLGGNDAQAYSDTLVKHAGYGFHFDTQKQKLETKYTCGLAIMQLPFFAAGHIVAKNCGYEANGFSKPYHLAIMCGAIVYAWLGLGLMMLFLLRYFNMRIAFFVPLIFFISTNLYYYAVSDPGMAHAWSFFLFALVLYMTPRIYEKPSLSNFLLLFSALALAILIRPTNILLTLFPLLFNVNGRTVFQERLKLFKMHLLKILAAGILSLLLFVPQLLYWKDLSGSYIYYSYGEESFIWTRPMILEAWFSVQNGLFLFAPVLVLSVAGLVLMIRKKYANGILITFIFLAASYVLSCWWNWYFGCAFGARSYVEYFPLLMIPMAWVFEKGGRMLRYTMIAFILVCISANFDMIYYYSGCLDCKGHLWDLNLYMDLFRD